MNFNDGKLDNISNFCMTGLHLAGTTLGLLLAASIFQSGNWGTMGVIYTLRVAGADEEMNLSNNILLFYSILEPLVINHLS